MKKCKFFLIVVMTFSTMSVFSQSYPVEVSLSIGNGFYWTPSSMVINDVYTRDNQMALVNGGTPFPAFETYGAALRYLFTRQWSIQLQGMRQRMRFMEIDNRTPQEIGNYNKLAYYNAMWNVDLQAEYNFLKYGGASDLWTPYVSFGVGASIHSKTAQYRWGGVGKREWTDASTTAYPVIKDPGFALYVPLGVGVKFRLARSWQLKFACQYQMYLMGNPAGGTMQPLRDLEKGNPEKGYIVFDKVLDANGNPQDGKVQYTPRVSYEDLPKGPFSAHNIVASVGVIYTVKFIERTVTAVF